MVIRAILFDFDGVLADSERLQYEALRQALNELGMNLIWEDYLKIGVGLPDRETVRLALRLNGIEDDELAEKVLDRKTCLYDVWLPDRLPLPEGMGNVVRALSQRFILAIASGAFKHQIEAVLTREGLRDCFAVIVSHDDYQRGKPDPTPFLLALERLNAFVTPPLRSHECLVVEDAPVGIQAARAAGMRCIAITTYFPEEALQDADVVVSQLKDLLLPHVWERFEVMPLL